MEIKKKSLIKEGMELQDEEVTAYHGSPYSFKKFSTQNIGTGEGVQAFGWGLYFTDLEDIARQYTKAGEGAVFIDKTPLSKRARFQKLPQDEKIEVEEILRDMANGDLTKNELFGMAAYRKGNFLTAFNFIRDAKEVKFSPKATLYKVSLHKGKTPEQYTWLEWDKPVNKYLLDKFANIISEKDLEGEIHKIELSDRYDFDTYDRGKTWKVGDTTRIGAKNEFIATFKTENDAQKYTFILNLKNSKVDGKNLYEALSSALNSQKEASLLLLKNGIDGIKFPAESIARGKTSDTARGFNYVVFDENIVNIEKQTQLEEMEVSKKDLENQKLINQAHSDITRTKGKDYAPDVHEIQKWINNPKKLREDAEDANFVDEITKGELEEAKKKKGDRCTRIAKSKYDVWPSAYASGAVVKCRQGKIWKGLKEEEEQSIDKRKIYVLVGPPSVGKSTWIKNTFGDIQPYTISRDDIVEQVADNLGWTYDDLFVAPPQGSQLGDYDEKYGEVIQSPSYMSWQPLSFSKVLEANNQVHVTFTKRVSSAVNSGKDIVVDMTNMTAGARKNALKAIEGNENLFEKIAVVFPFQGAEDVIIDVARKRAEAAKRMGKSKTLPDSVMRKMFASFQDVSPEEGFDKVVQQDNRELLSTLNEKWSKKYKRSIDCNNPKGFSQKAHCKGRLKEEEGSGMVGVEQLEKELLDKYKGLKTLFLSASKGVLSIDMIEINLNERNKGIGSNVINDIIEYADANNMEIRLNPAVKDARTGTTSRNRLVKFYKSFGFIENTGRNIDYTKKSGTMYRLPKSVEQSLDEKTDFSKEKSKGLHGWFERQGGKGKSKGWVDCNTCRDGKCKSCGRKEGESRSKYPACRPTPSACKTKGKGKSWGKKSTNEDVLNESVKGFTKQDIERELKLNEIKSLFQRHIGKL